MGERVYCPRRKGEINKNCCGDLGTATPLLNYSMQLIPRIFLTWTSLSSSRAPTALGCKGYSRYVQYLLKVTRVSFHNGPTGQDRGYELGCLIGPTGENGKKIKELVKVVKRKRREDIQAYSELSDSYIK